jgi:hypothetical protein
MNGTVAVNDELDNIWKYVSSFNTVYRNLPGEAGENHKNLQHACSMSGPRATSGSRDVAD